MKNHFIWYLPPSDDEFNQIWNTALLTLDTNVLLDLYRVHSDTRAALMDSISAFSGILWISNQVATEFIKNINKVKDDSKKIFNEIQSIKEDLKKYTTSSTQSILGKKVLNKEVVKDFEKIIMDALNSFENHISESKEKHLNTLKTDTILNWVVNSFDGVVGDPIPDSERDAWNEEAKRRIEQKIPPGFMDKNKDDEGQYGDIFLWKQVLVKARESSTPIIFITSEQKEDWWEKHSGEISGQRFEMLKEAYDVAKQKIIIFRTENFIRTSALRQGSGKLDPKIEAAIVELSDLRDENRLINVAGQIVSDASEFENKGLLTVQLYRPARYFTGSGRLTPVMAQPPKISATLTSSPDGLPKYRLKAGTGTRYDFNIHVKCIESMPFPAGTYVFQYDATCDGNDFFDSQNLFDKEDFFDPQEERVTGSCEKAKFNGDNN